MWEQITRFYFTFFFFRVADFPGAIIPLKPKGEEHWAFPPHYRAGWSQTSPCCHTPLLLPCLSFPAQPSPPYLAGVLGITFLKHFEALQGKALETCMCWWEPRGFVLPKRNCPHPSHNAGLVPITWETFCSSFLDSITTLKLKCIFLLEVQTSKCF